MAKRRAERDIVAEFRAVVNMRASRLERWLETDESWSVGWGRDAAGESVGHRSGRRIVKLLRTKGVDHTDDDLAHMRKVIAYARRHLAQRPRGDFRASRWRYSLMNWGHDPMLH